MDAPAIDPLDYGRIREELPRLLDLSEQERGERLEQIAHREPQLARNLRGMLLLADSPGDPSEDDLDGSLLRLDEVLGEAVGPRWLDDEAWDHAPAGSPAVAPGNAQAAGLSRPRWNLPDLGPGYKAIAWLGSGTVADVLLAEKSLPARLRVAVKVFREQACSASTERRFRREAEILARLQHPGIARILDAGCTPTGRFFLAVELVEGAPIDKAADAAGLGLPGRIDLIIQLCDAVEHAHRQGVIHRDLKPGNVLVATGPEPRPEASPDADHGAVSGAGHRPVLGSGHAPLVKVIDFGIARLLEQDPLLDPTISKEGHLLGTLNYMSPEQLAGRPVETRSDIYAIGLILLRLLTGRTSNLADRLRDREAPPSLELHDAARGFEAMRRSLRRGQIRELEAVVGKALASDPEARYSSPAALAEDLRRFLRDLPVRARPHTLLDQVAFAVRRSPQATAAALLGVALALLGTALLALAWIQISGERRSQREEIVLILDNVLDSMYPLMEAGAPRKTLTTFLLARADSLLAFDPRNFDLRVARARLLQELGNVEFESGEVARAGPIRAQVLEEFRTLAALRPNDLRLRRRLSEAAVRHGDVMVHLGRRDEARSQYRQALVILEAGRKSAPDDVGLLDDLTWAYGRLWDDQDVREDPRRVRDLIERRTEVEQHLLSLDPERTLTWFTIMEGHRARAGALDLTGNPLEASRALDQAVAIGTALVTREPRRLHYGVNLGHVLLQATRLARSVGDRQREERFGRQLAQVSASLRERDPWRTEILHLRLSERLHAEAVAREAGDREAARQAASEIVELAQILQKREGADSVGVRDLIATGWLRAAASGSDGEAVAPPR